MPKVILVLFVERLPAGGKSADDYFLFLLGDSSAPVVQQETGLESKLPVCYQFLPRDLVHETLHY
jgi:hypothetical protein